MELKPYQKKVLSDLQSFLEYIQEYKKIDKAFNQYWTDKIGRYNPLTGEGMEHYKNNIPKAPNVCIKVPTAGGKTFIACNSLKVIFDAFDYNKSKTVIWLVPSITILDQTIKNLTDSKHPYRQKINTHFNNKVEIYTKDELLQGAGFNPTSVNEQLSILILSFDSLRSRNKDDRKIYQENGQLVGFAEVNADNSHVLENIDETALINVMRKLNPVVIVDESHNAVSELSIEMLKNLNPCFVLDLTATPRENSNIISFVDAFELKKENMVKLPVIVYNHHDKTDVINSALQLQKKLERLAVEEEKKGGQYIRPIILFQAQPKTSDDNTTFEKIKQKLIELKIPEEQIKIKTAKNNELRNIDLLSKDCHVRYIITVNALKEGWDCPFAYILATLADRSSEIDVEQILGRILRQPYVTKHQNQLLNLSYVLTASSKFMDTLNSIIKGLNNAGFSSKDYKIPESIEKEFLNENNIINTAFNNENITQKDSNDFSDIDISKINFKNENSFVISEIEQTAIIQNEMLEKQIEETNDKNDEFFFSSDLQNLTKFYPMKDIFKETALKIKLPQFFLKTPDLGIFGEGNEILLTKEILLKEFKLSQQNTEINFEDISSELYQVDLDAQADEHTPVFMKIDKKASDYLLKFILSAPQETKVNEITARIMDMIGNMWPIADDEIIKYIKRISENFDAEKITDYFNREYTYVHKIKNKIRELTEEHAEKEFLKLLDIDKIFVDKKYSIPEIQTPGDLINEGIPKSLYEKEHSMNNFEKKVINDIANLQNISFWTKIKERKGFCINGFINHYPDFIVVTKSGRILIIETKGDDRDNTDSMKKIRLGRAWANKAGDNYKYFMIFDKKSLEGAYPLAEVLKLIKEI